MSQASILESLKTSFIGRNVLYFETVSSTMNAARRAARDGAPEGTLVIAEEQTAGRGRRGRDWLSVSGNLMFSVVLRPSIERLPSLIMVASLAVTRAIETTTRLRPRIKWPNDVLIGGKKVCGVLIESDIKGGAVDFAIVGIGLNVNEEPGPTGRLAIPPTSLASETGRRFSRLEVLSQVMLEMERLYTAVKDGGSVFEAWRRSLETLGRQVQVKMDSAEIVGLAENVKPDGSLLLRLADGSLQQIVAGDVSLRET
ncbi:MAG: biotin--[acetyl-CoA-carboxylase] ligase [Chloroflexi bacterium]|nr:biotin--[acetyl-CoA-carboxylase] ligase [Chloroflexota bacterium]